MESEKLAAIRARLDAASPGPWHNAGYPLKGRDGPEVMLAGDVLLLTMEARPNDDADAAFIAHARQDVPALLDEVARLAAEVERLSAMVPRWVFATPSLGDLMVGECRIGSVLQVVPLDWNAWVTDLNGAAWSYIGWEQTVEAACAAVCRRLGLPYIAPPENTNV